MLDIDIDEKENVNNQFDCCWVIDKKILSSALAFMNSVVDKKNAISILSNIKIEACNNHLILTATDSDISIKEEVGALVEKEGSITVDCKMLTDVVRKMPEGDLSFKFSEETSQISVENKNCIFYLPTIPAINFPIIDLMKNEVVQFSLPAANLMKMIEYTRFATCLEETRYNLVGICFHISNIDNQFAAVALDGHRLAYLSVDLPESINKFDSLILPKKSANEIFKILKDPLYSSLDVEIKISQTKIQFTCGNIVLISKLIDATFPDYDVFLSQPTKNKLLINAKLLAEAVDRINTITAHNFKAVKLIFADNMLRITAFGESASKAKEDLFFSEEKDSIVRYEGDDFNVVFNPQYLLDILAVVQSQDIEILFSDVSNPSLIKEKSNNNSVFAIMPIII